MLEPDHVLAFVLLDVAVILVVAHPLGALARRLGQPSVVGEIVAGVLLGPTLLGRTVSASLFPPQARSVLGILGQIGLMLFLFLVGLELDWDLIKGKGTAIGLVGVGVVAVAMTLGLVIGPLLYDERYVAAFGTPAQAPKASFALMVGAMLASTAFPITARILQERKLIQTPIGSIGVAAAAAATVLVFLAVGAATNVATSGGGGRLAVKFVLVATYIAVLFLVLRPALAPLGRAYEAGRALTPVHFAVIIILLLASSYAADRIGINLVVGSFLAGVVMPARKKLVHDMAARLGDLTVVVLLPIFLAFSGLNTDFTTLGTAFLPGFALFLVAGILGHWLGGAVFARLGGLSWAEGNVLGVLLNCRGLLVLVVALVALDQGVITGPMYSAAVLMALVTTVMTGPLVDAFLPDRAETSTGATMAARPKQPPTTPNVAS